MHFQVKSTLKNNRNHILKHEKNEGFSIGTLRLPEGYHWDILNYKSRSERIKQSSVLFCSVLFCSHKRTNPFFSRRGFFSMHLKAPAWNGLLIEIETTMVNTDGLMANLPNISHYKTVQQRKNLFPWELWAPPLPYVSILNRAGPRPGFEFWLGYRVLTRLPGCPGQFLFFKIKMMLF